MVYIGIKLFNFYIKFTLKTQQQPPWMLELKKTQAEKKNVEVGKIIKKNFSLTDENNSIGLNQTVSSLSSSATITTTNSITASTITSTTTTTNNNNNTFNGNSPNSSKKLINQLPNSPTKLTTSFNHRMSGDYSQRFKDFLNQQQQNSPNVNSLSRHSSVNNSNNHNFNSSRTLSTDSLDCKEQSSSLGFGNLNLASPFTPIVKPIKAAKPTTANKFMSSSPTTISTTNSFLSNLNNNTSTNTNSNTNNNSNSNGNSITNHQLINNNKDTVSRKEFDELQKRVKKNFT